MRNEMILQRWPPSVKSYCSRFVNDAAPRGREWNLELPQIPPNREFDGHACNDSPQATEEMRAAATVEPR